MSLTSGQMAGVKVAAGLVVVGFGVVMAYGVFKGGVSARVMAVEKDVEEHGSKIDKLAEHAARSEADMLWIKDAVDDYDRKQEVVLTEIRKLKSQ